MSNDTTTTTLTPTKQQKVLMIDGSELYTSLGPISLKTILASFFRALSDYAATGEKQHKEVREFYLGQTEEESILLRNLTKNNPSSDNNQ